MIVLPVADFNSQSLECVLDDELFYLIIDWNDEGEYWEMGLRNSAFITLVDGICMAPNYLLLNRFKYSDMPIGDLQVLCNSDRNGPPPRDGFATKAYQLIYLTGEEILAIKNAF